MSKEDEGTPITLDLESILRTAMERAEDKRLFVARVRRIATYLERALDASDERSRHDIRESEREPGLFSEKGMR